MKKHNQKYYFMKKLEFNNEMKNRAKILGKAKERRLKSYCFMLIFFVMIF